MSSPPPPQRGWQVDTTKDIKSQLAQRIFNSLVQDALSKLALDTYDAEARRRVRSAASGSGKPDAEGADKHADGSNEDDGRPSDSTKDSGADPSAPAKSGTGGGGGGSVVATPAYANPLIRCMVCNRHVSSNRFAPHLAKCMGLGANNVSSKSGNGGLKRKAAVGAATAAALAAAASASGAGAGSGSGSQSGIPSKRGRPPKSRGGTGSARSTATPVPGLGHKEGSAAP